LPTGFACGGSIEEEDEEEEEEEEEDEEEEVRRIAADCKFNPFSINFLAGLSIRV
jgi:hypothetical protein